ncbi:hypothetical protein EVAR_14045_1 [Eumeta japonica]|uniref:Uncharacterized protein n=1 Tax=Eumeta variegata TaxID=151549 RepID=A0A4C1UP71_EUMVA|nr:hypothetical protein EVAR_14045_1 [Eumeta japonica]
MKIDIGQVCPTMNSLRKTNGHWCASTARFVKYTASGARNRAAAGAARLRALPMFKYVSEIILLNHFRHTEKKRRYQKTWRASHFRKYINVHLSEGGKLTSAAAADERSQALSRRVLPLGTFLDVVGYGTTIEIRPPGCAPPRTVRVTGRYLHFGPFSVYPGWPSFAVVFHFVLLRCSHSKQLLCSFIRERK